MSMVGVASIPCRSPGCARAFGSTLGRDTHEGQQHGHVFNVQIVGPTGLEPAPVVQPFPAPVVPVTPVVTPIPKEAFMAEDICPVEGCPKPAHHTGRHVGGGTLSGQGLKQQTRRARNARKPRRKPTRRTAPSRATKVSRNGRARRTPARALVTLKMDEDDARKLLAILGEEAFGIDDLAIADVEVIEESAYRHGLYARIRRQLEAQTA